MKYFKFLFFLSILTFVFNTYATKPCVQITKAKALWVIKAKVLAIAHKRVAYVNCYLKDRSKCAMRDQATLKIELVKIIKGKVKIKKSLFPDYCSNGVPLKIGYYIFWGQNKMYYRGFESLN